MESIPELNSTWWCIQGDTAVEYGIHKIHRGGTLPDNVTHWCAEVYPADPSGSGYHHLVRSADFGTMLHPTERVAWLAHCFKAFKAWEAALEAAETKRQEWALAEAARFAAERRDLP